jgi:hypothetical protein
LYLLLNNCQSFKKTGFYFNEEQYAGDICLENNEDDDDGYDWQIIAGKLNIKQQNTFQSLATINDNVLVSRLLFDNKIMGLNNRLLLNINISNNNS